MAGQRVDGYQVFRRYFSIVRHFSDHKFNIFTGSRIKYTRANYDNRKDKTIFEALSYEYLVGDVSNYFMANIIAGNTHVSSMTDVCFREWKIKMNSLHYIFEEDIKVMLEVGVDFRDLWKSISGGLPLALQMLNGKLIRLETICLVNLILKGSMMENMDEQITDKFMWPNIRNTIIKYERFIRYDEDEIKSILLKYI